MAQQEITFNDKTNKVPIVEREKQVAAEDLNEIKEVVNKNAQDAETRLDDAETRLGEVETDVVNLGNNKSDKPITATEDNLVVFDANKNPTDSGKSIETSLSGDSGKVPDSNAVKAVTDSNKSDIDNNIARIAVNENDIVTLQNSINGYQPQGDIAVAADFPTPLEVQVGHLYYITANVTDNDPTKTNTGQSFLAGESIVWNASGSWTNLGQGNLTPEQLNKLTNGANYYGEINLSSPAKTGLVDGATVLPLEDGVYTNFGGLERNQELCVFVYQSSVWTKSIVKGLNNIITLNLNWISGEFYDVNADVGSIGTYSRISFDARGYQGCKISMIGKSEESAFCHFVDNSGNIISSFQTTDDFYKGIIPDSTYQIFLSNRHADIPNPSVKIGNLIDKTIPSSYIVENLKKSANVYDWKLTSYYNSSAVEVFDTATYSSVSIDIEKYAGISIFRYEGKSELAAWCHILDSSNDVILSFQTVGDRFELFIPLDAKTLLLSNRHTSVEFPILNFQYLLSPEKLPYTDIDIDWRGGKYYTNLGVEASQENWANAKSIDVTSHQGKSFIFSGRVDTTDSGYCVFKDGGGTILSTFRTTNNIFTGRIPDTATELFLSNRLLSFPYPRLLIDYSLDSFETVASLLSIKKTLGVDFSGKTIGFLGDSITEQNLYVMYLAAALGAKIVNLGVSSTTIADNPLNGLGASRFITRVIPANLADVDFLIVFGGTNDFTYDSKPIGDYYTISPISGGTYIGTTKLTPPVDKDTFSGALHELILEIQAVKPLMPFMFVTPLHRSTYSAGRPTSAESNLNGDYLKDFVSSIKEICSFYSIPVCDLYSYSGLDFKNIDISNEYSQDKLHPNDKGGLVVANNIFKFISNIFFNF